MDNKKQNLDKIVGLAVTILFMLLAGSNPVRSLEWLAYSWGVRITPVRSPDTSIAVIAIDDASIKAYGDWPWDRSRLANIIKILNRSECCRNRYQHSPLKPLRMNSVLKCFVN